MSLDSVLVVFAVGAVAGFIGALFGVGGGILIVPVLASGFGVPMHTAIGTSLLCVVATSSAAASRNIRSGMANVKLASLLEPCTVVGAIAGAFVAGFLRGETLMTIFGVTLMLMAIPMSRGQAELGLPAGTGGTTHGGIHLRGRYRDEAKGSEIEYEVERAPSLMGISVGAGVLSGLLGVGGGIVQVPVMTMLGRIPMKAAAATSNMMIGVTAVASALVYYGRGDLSPALAAAAVTGVFLGSKAGVTVAARIHGSSLGRGFAVFMVLMGIQLLLKANGLWFS